MYAGHVYSVFYENLRIDSIWKIALNCNWNVYFVIASAVHLQEIKM